MTPAVCRLLFVCFFCTLWGGQVIAKDGGTKTEDVKTAAAKAKGAEDATQKVEGYLTKAEECANKAKGITASGADYSTQATSNVSCLADAVKNATEAAKEANTSAKEAVKSLEKETTPDLTNLKKCLADAATNAKDLEDKLSTLNITTKELNEKDEYKKDDSKKKELTAELDKILKSLVDVKKALGKAKGSHNAAAEKAKNILEEFQKPPKDDSSHGSGGGGASGGKGGKDDKPSTTTPTTESGGKNTPSSATQDGMKSDSAHGGAITTWAQAPLLLLIAVLAYAAVR